MNIKLLKLDVTRTAVLMSPHCIPSPTDQKQGLVMTTRSSLPRTRERQLSLESLNKLKQESFAVAGRSGEPRDAAVNRI